MKRIVVSVSICFAAFLQNAVCYDFYLSEAYENRTDPATRQLYDFRKEHPKPVGLLTKSSGDPVEIKETNTLNSDLFINRYFIDTQLHVDGEKIPARVVHTKGAGAFGYFEVTHDVSNYTKADVFNGIGRKTPVLGRFSPAAQDLGGSDLAREIRALSIKFYTREGNLDLLCLNHPVYLYKNPVQFPHVVHALKRNPQTNLQDATALLDIIVLRPESLPSFLWLMSDYGNPNGYRHMDVFPIHTYEIYNKHGDKYFVKFNFRTAQGIENLPDYEAMRINARDPDYFTRDLYNAIETKNYPVWNLEMDVMTFDDVLRAKINPFQVNRLWRKGTYRTVPVGRLVLNKNPDNYFRVIEQSAFNPGNLVPGIGEPSDLIYKARVVAYPDAQNHRLGINHNRIEVNTPVYSKEYNRDGLPPLKHNMKNFPNYYPNSFSGPTPFVDAAKPKERLIVYESNAIDLEEGTYFYREILKTDDERDRLANNTIPFLLPIPPFIQERYIRLMYLTDKDLGDRVVSKLKKVLALPPEPEPQVLRVDREQCDWDDNK